MNVAAHRPVIAFVLNHLGAVPTLEQVALSPPAPPRPDRIAGKEALHAHAKIRTRRLEQQMEMISHDDVAKQLPPAADDSLFKAGDQPPSVRIITDDLLACVAPRHDVIDGALKFDPQSPWHGTRLDAWKTDCQAEKQKTRSVTAKCQCAFMLRSLQLAGGDKRDALMKELVNFWAKERSREGNLRLDEQTPRNALIRKLKITPAPITPDRK